jgi:hypothetical protein
MKHKTLFRLALKLVGVWLFLSATGQVFNWMGYLVMMFMPSMNMSMGANWPYYVFQFAGLVIQMGLGLYLFFGGRWIADMAIPSNKLYCHECGYDLTGAIGHVCTECGTAFKAR